MSYNALEENLGVIQRQKAELKRRMKTETNRDKLMKIACDIRDLSIEERKILNKLGAEI